MPEESGADYAVMVTGAAGGNMRITQTGFYRTRTGQTAEISTIVGESPVGPFATGAVGIAGHTWTLDGRAEAGQSDYDLVSFIGRLRVADESTDEQ